MQYIFTAAVLTVKSMIFTYHEILQVYGILTVVVLLSLMISQLIVPIPNNQ